MKFLQKYYHKGAFYMDQENELYKVNFWFGLYFQVIDFGTYGLQNLSAKCFGTDSRRSPRQVCFTVSYASQGNNFITIYRCSYFNIFTRL